MFYQKFADQLDVITPEELNSIELKANSLSLEQCFDALFIDRNELSEKDLSYCERAFKKGRAEALAKAGNSMFEAMTKRDGGKASLEYLERMSGTFKQEPQAGAGGATGNGFSFRVTLNDEQNPPITSDDPMAFGVRQ